VLRGFPEDKVLGLGVIDVLSAEVDEAGVLLERCRSARRYVGDSRIVLNPDCGFAPAADNPISLDEAYLKLRAVSDAARRMRSEDGAAESPFDPARRSQKAVDSSATDR